jgi:HAD superfamily hydrolase (TIGR01490 family)
MRRPFAAFDIDGTVIRWQLYHAIADELARNGLIDTQAYKTVRAARLAWKNRVRPNAFSDYEKKLVRVVDEAVTGLTTQDIQQACEAVIRRYKDQVYTYTRDLIRELKAKNYTLFAISASQIEIVEPIASYYGFDDFGGSEFEYKNGHFTGKKHTLVSGYKPEFLKILADKHNVTWQNSIAVGDSEGDIPMLNIVEQPIAFNPTRLLYDHAKQHNWRIVVERKNVIYKLDPGTDGYELES